MFVSVVGLDIGEAQPSNHAIVEFPPGHFRTIVEGLDQATQYRIHVRATTNTGEGTDYFIDVKTATPGGRQHTTYSTQIGDILD